MPKFNYNEFDVDADEFDCQPAKTCEPKNPKNRPCPNCGTKNSMTPKDIAIGNVCNNCSQFKYNNKHSEEDDGPT